MDLLKDRKSSGRTNASYLWKFFEPVGDKKARCAVCLGTFSYLSSITNLRHHLNRRHPTLRVMRPGENENDEVGKKKKIILCPHTGEQLIEETKDDSLANHMDNNQDFADVYLSNVDDRDTDDGSDSKPTAKASRRHGGQHRKHKFAKSKRKVKDETEYSSSDEEPIEKLRRSKPIDKDMESVDYFCKYISSLLKNLPTDIADRLQLEFITQVMNEKVIHERNTEHERRNVEQ